MAAKEYQLPQEYKPPQRASELLGRYANGERYFDLAYLVNSNLCGARLHGAVLSRANLWGAGLSGTHLLDAKLVGADCSRADLSGASFVRANLTAARLRHATAPRCYFTQAVLYDADMHGAKLHGADLRDVNLTFADMSKAELDGTNLVGARLPYTNLDHASLMAANLEGADLSCATLRGADLTGANLARANLMGANIAGAKLTRAILVETQLSEVQAGGVRLDDTLLMNLDISALCEAYPPVVHQGRSRVDYQSVILSLRSPHLLSFLQRTGMPEIFAEYMVECARAIDGNLIKKLLQSTFISYGGPDEPFARRLYEALYRNGVTTFFFPEHAKPGQRIGRVVRENLESYDRILLICSKASLDRPGVLYEIEETLERERRDGGAEYLIPVLLDDHLLSDWKPARADVARSLRDRVCADFRGAQEDEAVFQAGLRKLIAALRPPDLALWRPPGSTKPSEP